MAYQIGHAQRRAGGRRDHAADHAVAVPPVAGLLSRDQHNTIFDRAAIPGRAQLRRYGIALLAIIAVTLLDPLERIFGTTELSLQLWATCDRRSR